MTSTPYPEPTQFDAKSPYYDARSKPDEPRWLLVDVQVLRQTRSPLLPQLRAHKALQELVLQNKRYRFFITQDKPQH